MKIEIDGINIKIQCNNPKPCVVFSDKCYTCPDIKVNDGNIINPTRLYFIMRRCKGISHWRKKHLVKAIKKDDLRDECNNNYFFLCNKCYNNNSIRLDTHNQEIEMITKGH